MSNLEENIITLNSLMNNEKLKDLKLVNGCIELNGEKISLDKINVSNIINSNEKLKNDVFDMEAEDLFKILKINSLIIQNSLKSENDNTFESNLKKVSKVKEFNDVMKNIIVINREEGVSHQQYFNIVDSLGNTHIFKNDRNLDITKVINAFLSTNNDSLDILIAAINRYLPEVYMKSIINDDQNSYISEDFKNKIESIKKEFEDNKAVEIYGNEQEEIITIIDRLNPQNNETRVYKRDKDNNLVMEKYNRKIEDTKINENNNEKKDKSEIENDNQNELEKENFRKDSEETELIPFDEFKKLINLDLKYNKEQEEQVNLWNQTLEDIYLYQDYLSLEITNYFHRYEEIIMSLQLLNQKNGNLNENQINAIDAFKRMIENKDKKLEEMNQNRKENFERKRVLEEKFERQEGKISIIIISSIVLVAIIFLIYLITKLITLKI